MENMLYKRTIAEARADMDRHAQEIREQLSDVGELVALAILVVGTVAAVALVFAVVRELEP